MEVAVLYSPYNEYLDIVQSCKRHVNHRDFGSFITKPCHLGTMDDLNLECKIYDFLNTNVPYDLSKKNGSGNGKMIFTNYSITVFFWEAMIS